TITHRVDGTPTPLLDGLHQGRVSVLDTQELRMGLRSVEAILRRRGDGGDHLALRAIKMSRFEHHLTEEGSKRRCDPRIGGDESSHRREEPEIVRVVPVGRYERPQLFAGGNRDPRLTLSHCPNPTTTAARRNIESR